ncbi:ThiF family adenylyltransferase [Acidobacteriia bacterium AH_259_A11_L15]|nr:ThiF family adenylyltransferase [Acidobacteriia bacterium AH_259_A11_L15]
MARKNNRNSSFCYEEWFSAQQSLIGIEGSQALRQMSILIAGAGGLGYNLAVFAARSGVEAIYQCDSQVVEVDDNLNRIFANTRHLGKTKLSVVEELLHCFDRASVDKNFNYTPLAFPVEHPRVRVYLKQADFLMSSPNSIDSRLWLLRYARDNKKLLFNVGFSCAPGKHMSGEVSIFRPSRRDLACPACISLKAQDDSTRSPLFYPPLAVLAAFAIHLAIAEVTNFDCLGEDRPNYFLYDGFSHLLAGFRLEPDPDCEVCQTKSPMREKKRFERAE